MKNLIKVLPSVENTKNGVLEVYIEARGYDWVISYFVYKDKVVVSEYMNGIDDYCNEECKTLDEAIEIASQWC